LKAGDLDGAAGHAFVARLITARPFLPGVEGIWADEWRRRLQELRIRAVECMADVQLQRGQTSAAIQSAELVLGLDELRESGWRILMRAHAAAGNVGTALRAFERCRLTLHEQLGTMPSPSTRAAHSELLREGVTPGTERAGSSASPPTAWHQLAEQLKAAERTPG
jgi:SARP family transcriptional regulator, regulator of embCAB operon